jgi:DNA-binding IclR family transcriptional regulator
MNASHRIIMAVLHDNEPSSVSLDEIEAQTTGMSRSEIAGCLSDLYLMDFVEPVRYRPSDGYLLNVRLTDAGRAHHLHQAALPEGEDPGDVSDHLLRGAL